MKEGSLVEYISLAVTTPFLIPHVKWEPVLGETYTIRAIEKSSIGETICVGLCEGVLGYYYGEEIGIDIKHFRELQPPMDLSELMEEVKIIHV